MTRLATGVSPDVAKRVPRTLPPTRTTRAAPLMAAGALAAAVMALVVAPKYLTYATAGHIGIAQAAPTLATYTILIALAGLYLFYRAIAAPMERVVPTSMWCFCAFLAVASIAAWGTDGENVAGILQLGSGVVAWAAGAYLGRRALREVRSVRLIAALILGVIVLEALVMGAQAAGFSINPMDPETAALMGERVNGTLNHPNNLGKAVLMLLLLALGLLAVQDSLARKMLWSAIILAFIPLALAQGRANLLAAVLLLVFWALLSPRGQSLAARIGIPLLVLVLIVPFLGTFLDRLAADPEGGERPRLQAVAIEQIAMRPAWGTGPNSFVSTVSAYDSVVATGYSVHNAFLLSAAEMGLFGAVLFWLPVLGLIRQSWSVRKKPGYPGAFGAALIASLPGMYVIMSTGWAMMSASLLPLWFLVFGVVYSQVHRAPRPVQRRSRTPWKPNRVGPPTSVRQASS